jgi:DNA-binding LacI/PurR family transcriptional regulator
MNRVERLQNSGRKKTQLLAQLLQEDILNGVYIKGQKLPSYDDFGSMYEVNRLTARKAIKELEDQGLVHSIAAKGTYVGSAPKADEKQQNPTKMIGIVSELVHFQDMGYHHMDLFNALQKNLMEHQYQLTPIRLGEQQLSEALSQCDGFIVIGPMSLKNTQKLQTMSPMIHIDPQRSTLATAISADYEKAGMLAAHHLFEKGHEKIAVIHGNQSCSKKMWQGFEESCPDSKKLSIESFYGDYTAPTARKITESLIVDQKIKAHREAITAIFCMNDEMAAGAIQALSRYNYNIPEDISVLGFDNSSIAPLLDPPLETIGISIQDMGKRAIDQLMSLLNNQPIDNSMIMITPKLIPRESVAKL